MSIDQKIVQKRFEVDTDGFKLQMAGMKPSRIVQEIVSNSFDEDSVKNIVCTITQKDSKNLEVMITDDGDGFQDINDAYTMYKYSYKRSNTEKRGRFNLGEKQFFVLAENGYVKTRNQMVEFTGDKRIISSIDLSKGTIVYGLFKWSGSDMKDILQKLHKLIVPQGKVMFVNDAVVKPKTIVKEISIALPTLIEDSDTKILRRVTKTTKVNLYKVNAGEKPYLYELGIPVHKLLHSMEWHVDVRQKIPLPTGRDMVSEAYLNDLYSGILNQATDLIDNDNAGSKWVTVGLSKSTPESAKHVLEKQFGTDKLYIPSTTDYHANEAVLENGGELLKSGLMDRETREHLKEIGVLKISTMDYASDSSERCEPANITPAMAIFERLVKAIARDTIKKEIKVQFVNSDSSHSAWYGRDTMTFNIEKLEKNCFMDISPKMVGIIIHELSHDLKHDEGENVPHFTKEFVSELERIGGIVGKNGISYYFNLARTWSES